MSLTLWSHGTLPIAVTALQAAGPTGVSGVLNKALDPDILGSVGKTDATGQTSVTLDADTLSSLAGANPIAPVLATMSVTTDAITLSATGAASYGERFGDFSVVLADVRLVSAADVQPGVTFPVAVDSYRRRGSLAYFKVGARDAW